MYYVGRMRLVILELSLIKLNFNSHISAVVHKAHVRASLILRSFVTRDFSVLTKAFIAYVRTLLEYCTSVWSPHTVNNINRIESCQRWFIKRFKGLFDKQYSERLVCLGLQSLQVRRLKHDLHVLQIVHSQLTIQNDNFLVFADYTSTRGHCYKLYKGQSHVNAHKFLYKSCL